MNTDNFLIEERDLELAQEVCRPLSDGEIKNRAIANAVSANIASKFFTEGNHTVDTETGLHNIAQVLEKYDISDIYVDDAYIDVRTFFSEEELSVPKSHFDCETLPSAYMFIKLTPELSGGTVIGFALPENIDTSSAHNGYYAISPNELVSFYDIESHLIKLEDTFSIEDKEIFSFLDGTLENPNEFIKELIASKDGRLRLAKAAKAQYIFNFVSINGDAQSEAAPVDLQEDSLLEEIAPADSETESFDLLEEAPSLDIEDSLEPALGDDSLLEEAHTDDDLLTLDTNSVDDTLHDDDSLTLVDSALDIEPSAPIVDAGEATLSDAFPEISVDEDTSQAFSNFSDEIKMAGEDSDFAELVEPQNQENEGFTSIIEENTEPSSFDNFSTVASPSIDITEEDLDDISVSTEDEQASIEVDQTEPEVQDVHDEVADDIEVDESGQGEIDTLFGDGEDVQVGGQANADENFTPPVKKQGGSMKFLLIIGLLVVLCAAGFNVYNQFSANKEDSLQSSSQVETEPMPELDKQPVVDKDAMPVESVEAPATTDAVTNEGTSVAIPAIEQNLDASIIVANLKVDWEVPAGYASNTSAKRYLIKLGKIIQLNLKTELLLLNKPPITNKIAVEIKYNPSNRKFETVGVTTSSGEKSVDDIILHTVQKALQMNLSTNTDSFSNLQGNPTLIIRL